MESIKPWGEGDGRKLHWFGLTSGRYWISTPLGEALRYTDEQIKLSGLDSPYVDYQIARLFEDLQSILSLVLEPVPPDIAALVSDDEWRVRFDRIEQTSVGDQSRNLAHEMMAWYQNRSLDTMYLVNGPLFHMWRTGDSVAVRWEQTGANPVQVWAIPNGQFSIDVQHFRSVACGFLDDVLRTMQERVDIIEVSGWNRKDCHLDIPLLLQEQEQRTAVVEDLKQHLAASDWGAIRHLMERLSNTFR